MILTIAFILIYAKLGNFITFILHIWYAIVGAEMLYICSTHEYRWECVGLLLCSSIVAHTSANLENYQYLTFILSCDRKRIN